MSATMFRTTATRSLPRSFSSLYATTPRSPITNHVLKASLRTASRPFKAAPTLSLAVRQPMQKSLVRYQTTRVFDPKAEEALQKQVLKPHPEIVSTGSSVHPVRGEVGVEEHEDDVDMMAGIRSDFVSPN